jgi:hypothetical protein
MIDISILNKTSFTGRYDLWQDDDVKYVPVAFYGKKLNAGELFNVVKKNDKLSTTEMLQAHMLGVYGITNYELKFNKIGNGGDSDAKANLTSCITNSSQGEQMAYATVYALPKVFLADWDNNKLHESEGTWSLLDIDEKNHYNLIPGVACVPYLDSELFNKSQFPKVKIDGNSSLELQNIWFYKAADKYVERKKTIKPSEDYIKAIVKGITHKLKDSDDIKNVFPSKYTKFLANAWK